MDFPLHPANAPLPRLQPFPIGSFAYAHEGIELVKVIGVFDASGRYLLYPDGDIGRARIWDLTETDEEF